MRCDDVGELAEVFKAMKARSKKRKSERLSQADDSGWSKHTEYHWFRMIDGEKLNYWPSTGRCIFKGRSRNINSKFIKKLIGG